MQFHVLAFEGPDAYARAGGLASRVDGLTRALAALGFETHLWFVGDPDLPGHELREGVHLHRWCQWISRFHAGGVYQGEEGKHADYSSSLPPWLLEHVLGPHLAGNGEAAVLAEEWHTAAATLDLDRRLRALGLRERCALLWNANNLFGFDRIDWQALHAAAVITTVSRAMRFEMRRFGVVPLVLGNGLAPDAYEAPHRAQVAALRRRCQGRRLLVKVARWDPDKDWLGAVEAVRLLRDAGERPLLVARGGSEAHEGAVREAARRAGLRWSERAGAASGADGNAALLEALDGLGGVDVASLRFPLDAVRLRLLYRAADAVLANSRFEPFGLVGLEAMAVGGVACTGLTGEDYGAPGRNALVLQTHDARELVAVLLRLRAHPEEERRLRSAARRTARQYSWAELLKRMLLPRLELLRSPDVVVDEEVMSGGPLLPPPGSA